MFHTICRVFSSRLRSALTEHNIGSASLSVAAAALLGLSSLPLRAQQDAIILKGDAVVTGYSGISLFRAPPGKSKVDFAVINQQGPVLQIFDMSQMFGPDDARLVDAQRYFSVSARRIGQVFGVAMDDGAGRSGKIKTPDIYATATSKFGLQIVKTINGVRNRAKSGGPGRAWMGGQWGTALGGGPGSIWKIDGRTGDVTLFANVKLNGVENSGPALGNITFDSRSRKLYVSDMQTGMIHAFDLKGNEVAVFDHGVRGRPRVGLSPVAFDQSGRVQISSRAFKAAKPATWGFAEAGRQVWGVAVFAGRLYYSVAEGPEIWSVGLRRNGRFANDARVEVEVRAASGDPVSDITFASNGTMYLSQRGKAVSSYDYTVLAKPKTAAVLRYRKRKLPSGRTIWRQVPDEYAVGFPSGFRSSNGGIALGYGYDRFGFIRYGACQRTIWSTGELLRQNAKLASKLTPGGPMIVHGLQGNNVRLVKPANEAPFKTWFIDYDNHHADPSYRGHIGDVAIWSDCGGGSASNDKPPKPPVGPRIRIAKRCSNAAFGGQMTCKVTLTNRGSAAPTGRVGFTDVARILSGAPVGAFPLILSATGDDQSWRCSGALPADNLACSIEGKVMQPGHSHTVTMLMDVSGLVGTPNWRFRNCAKLNSTGKKKCVFRGENSALIVSKSGPVQQPCIAGGPCDFFLTVTNPGNRTFDGNLFFGDNISVGGGVIGGVTVDGIFPLHGCAIAGVGLPLEWQCHVTIPPGGQKTFNLLTTLPVGAGPPAGTIQGRNCFVAADPGLVLNNNVLPGNFWQAQLNPANAANAPGRSCVDFSIGAAPPGQIPPRVVPVFPKPDFWGPPILPGDVAAMTLTVTAAPAVFMFVGEPITFTYQLQNTGNVFITGFTINDNKVSPGIPIVNCDIFAIPVGGTATCTAKYWTVAADLGANIVSNATAEGTF